MFCGNCGAENANEAKFCKKCGKPLKEGTGQASNVIPTQGDSQSGTSDAASSVAKVNVGHVAGKIKALPMKFLIGACVVVTALIVIICIAVNTGSTIDLNKYLTIETEGYDGYGTARAIIDWDAIEEKYGDKLSFTNQAKNEYGEFLGVITPMDALQESVSVRLEENRGLSNGSAIAYTWDIDEELSTYVKCKIKYNDDSYTISGLEKVGLFDAFADLTVEFSGIAPNGRANLNYTGSEINYYDFNCDKTSGLSNGDTITVTINESQLEYYAENLGKVPETLEKEYEVVGLSSYLTQISEVNDTAFIEMQKQASDVYNAHIAQKWGDDESLESFTYIGSYLLTVKNKDSYWGSNNVLYLVYKAQVRDNYSYGGKTYNKVNDIYWYISFDDLMVESDGNLIVDVTDYSTPGDRFTIDSGVSSGWWSTKSWYYYGYQTLDELYKNVVSKNMDFYNHEDNIDESAVPEIAVEEEIENESGYIFPNSDTELLSKADLEGLSAEECKIARNEIYARHGRKFKDEELQAYFDACDWYEGTIDPDDFQESDLSDIEIANKDLIVEYEEEKGYK